MESNLLGHKPYLDLETGNRVYLPVESLKLK